MVVLMTYSSGGRIVFDVNNVVKKMLEKLIYEIKIPDKNELYTNIILLLCILWQFIAISKYNFTLLSTTHIIICMLIGFICR